MDIIEKLLNHDLTSLCFYIFSHLDSKSFANSRLVCQHWKKYLDYQFYKANVGKKCLQEKLKNNFLNDCYQPKVEKLLFFSQFLYVIVNAYLLLLFFRHPPLNMKKISSNYKLMPKMSAFQQNQEGFTIIMSTLWIYSGLPKSQKTWFSFV